MNDFKINSLTSRVTRITAPCGEMMYLLEGSEKAALIDSGLGFGSLLEAVRELTQKPVILLLTHGHLNLGAVVAGLPAGSFVFSGHSHIKGIGPQAAPAFVRAAASFPGSRRAGDSADDGRRDSEGGGGGVTGECGGSDGPAPAITFVNPGSIGHPKDGSASYALYERGAVKLRML